MYQHKRPLETGCSGLSPLSGNKKPKSSYQSVVFLTFIHFQAIESLIFRILNHYTARVPEKNVWLLDQKQKKKHIVNFQ